MMHSDQVTGRLRGLGLWRPPVATAAITVVTAAVSIAGLLSPALLAALQRTPAGLHGEVWRWVTSLLVQDGGVAGTVSNLLFLVLVGTAAEQVMTRRGMIGLYLAGGLVGQAAGYLWQPFGGGNSVAICGIAGALAWYLTRRAAPRWASSALVLWLGALLATWWLPLIVVGIVGVGLDQRLGLAPERRRAVLVGASTVVAVVLMVVANIHGVALAAGLVLGAIAAMRGRTVDPAEAAR
jgi:membrane associated rhomboid family serine protease